MSEIICLQINFLSLHFCNTAFCGCMLAHFSNRKGKQLIRMLKKSRFAIVTAQMAWDLFLCLVLTGW